MWLSNLFKYFMIQENNNFTLKILKLMKNLTTNSLKILQFCTFYPNLSTHIFIQFSSWSVDFSVCGLVMWGWRVSDNGCLSSWQFTATKVHLFFCPTEENWASLQFLWLERLSNFYVLNGHYYFLYSHAFYSWSRQISSMRMDSSLF